MRKCEFQVLADILKTNQKQFKNQLIVITRVRNFLHYKSLKLRHKIALKNEKIALKIAKKMRKIAKIAQKNAKNCTNKIKKLHLKYNFMF